LASALFGGDTPAISAEFILTPEIEAKLIVCDDTAISPLDDYVVDFSLFVTALSNIPFGDTIYAIATGVVQRKEI
jgi:hypothetical protein